MLPKTVPSGFYRLNCGDAKDRVVVKSNGELTYLATDIAFHYRKFQGGFDKMIDVWGADHHGYVERIRASIEALGHSHEEVWCCSLPTCTFDAVRPDSFLCRHDLETLLA